MYFTRSTKKKMISDEIKKYFENLVAPLAKLDKLDEYFDNIKNEIAAKFEQIVREQDNKIKLLESKIEIQNNTIEKLSIKCDDALQYQRRSCLRIHGVPVHTGVKSKEILTTLKDCYNKLDLTFQSDEIDRAHRIGKKYVDYSGNKVQTIIIKFKSWKARQDLYKSRPRHHNKSTQKPGPPFTVSLDLTYRRYQLLKSAKGAIKSNSNFLYAMADINCSLGIKCKDD